MFVAVFSRREVFEKCSEALNRAREVSRYLFGSTLAMFRWELKIFSGFFDH